MEVRQPTADDAMVILKLYELRQEERLRQARHWVLFTFQPTNAEEFFAVAQTSGSQENAFFRQATTYWEMAAGLVLRGAVNADVFLDSNGEGIAILAKFSRFGEAFTARTHRPLMAKTAELVRQFPAAQAIYDRMFARFKNDSLPPHQKKD
jgi:hypothetical protein